MSKLIEGVARERHAERYESSLGVVAPRHRGSRTQQTRARAGWLLVGLGLRLALPGQRDAASRITLVGR